MTALRNPDDGSVIQATGGLEERLIDQGWEPTDQPPAPGLRLVTAAELDQTATNLDQLAATLASEAAASQADRSDLRQMVEPMALQLPEVAAEVDELTATIEATTTTAAPKPTPRTDALEAWRTTAEQALATIQASVTALDVPTAVATWLAANPPPPGPVGKDAYEVARDQGYGGTRTQWLTTLVGAKGDKGDPGNTGPPGTTDYTQLQNKPTLGSAAAKDTGTGATNVILGNDARLTDARTPTAHTHPAAQVTGLHAVATSGDYNALNNKPAAAVNLGRRVIVNTGALTANVVKNVAATWPTAMPDTNYAVTALIESITPQNVAIGINPSSKTTAGCTLSVRSTVAVAAAGLNVHVIGMA